LIGRRFPLHGAWLDLSFGIDPVIAFLFRRLIALVAVLFGVATLTFLLIRMAPGSPFSTERNLPPAIEKALLEKYGLDGDSGRKAAVEITTQWGWNEEWTKRAGEVGSFFEQYTDYLSDLLKGDLRLSTKYRNRSVKEILAQTLPVSMTLGLTAFVIATVLGVSLGCVAALRHHTWVDHTAMITALLAISLPAFVTGPILVYVICLQWNLLPVGGWGTPAHLVLPALVLAAPFVAYIARLMRSSLLETLNQDFIRTARAKGVSEPAVLVRHALKVAILPVVSFLGPLAANLLTGSVIVESIFQIPGAGGFFVNSILNRDSCLLGGVVIIYCTLVVIMNLLVDISYTLLYRRIKLDG